MAGHPIPAEYQAQMMQQMMQGMMGMIGMMGGGVPSPTSPALLGLTIKVVLKIRHWLGRVPF